MPVSLSKDQLTQAFGPNVKLAKLSKLTSNEIQFVSINMSTVGDDEIAMQAYVPYIIFPTKHAEQTPAYTAKLSKIGNGEAEKVSVIIGKNHIDIPNVSFAVNGENKNDLSNMNTTNWTTNSSFDVDGPGTSFVTGNGMTAFGTFARTFGTGTQNTDEKDDNYGKWTITDKSNIIADRSDLKGCYFSPMVRCILLLQEQEACEASAYGSHLSPPPTAALPNLPTFSLMVYPWTRPLASTRSSMAKKKAELTDSPMASIA